MDSVSIYSIASRHAEYLSARQTAIASNIANAEVTTYKAKDTESFASVLSQTETGMRQTNKAHLVGTSSLGGIDVRTSDKGVALETELVKSSEVKTSMQMNAGLVSAFHRMFLATAKS